MAGLRWGVPKPAPPRRIFNFDSDKGQAMTPHLPAPIDDTGLGSAMLALNPAMRRFVEAKVFNGLNNTQAAAAAGYSAANAKYQGYRLAHDERVQAAIREQGRRLMRSEGAKSIQTLVGIRDDATADAKDRIKCAVELLNRSGFHAVSETHAHTHVHMSEAEQDRRILSLAAEMGLSPGEAQKMLIAPADMQKNAAGVYELAPEPEPAGPSPHAVENRAYRARRKGKTTDEWEQDKAQRRAAHAEQLRRERAEHEAARAATEALIIDDEEY